VTVLLAVAAFLLALALVMFIADLILGPDDDLAEPWDPMADAEQRRAER